jgi:hypothetical protein
LVRDPWLWGKPHEAARVHHAHWRRGGGVAAGGARSRPMLSGGFDPGYGIAKYEEAQINEANKRPNESNVGSDF